MLLILGGSGVMCWSDWFEVLCGSFILFLV